MNCKKCNTPIILVPSAAESAKKDNDGTTAAYYTNLFSICTECQVASWYNRPIVKKVENKKLWQW